jgi:hypothetical protein
VCQSLKTVVAVDDSEKCGGCNGGLMEGDRVCSLTKEVVIDCYALYTSGEWCGNILLNFECVKGPIRKHMCNRTRYKFF